MTDFIACRWHHESADYPVLLYSELDEERYEVRKVDEFADGRRVRTDSHEPSISGTNLGSVPVPALEEIDAMEEFTVLPLSRLEFERVWASATDAEPHQAL